MGGLGPAATAQFLSSVVKRTAADRDQEHVDLVVSQHSSTPDRTGYLLDPTQPNPAPTLIRDARMLERMGAEFIVIPCNTAHAFVEQVRKSISVEVLDILECTVAETTTRCGGRGGKVGLLATDGTLKTGMYQRELANAGHQTILPDRHDQDLVMEVIYGDVKAGHVGGSPVLFDVISRLREFGAEYFILGCTELPIAAEPLGLLDDRRVIDSVTALADATILRSGKSVRKK